MRRWQLGERPGEYKHHDFVTGKEEIGAAPEDVQEEITELLLELEGISDRNALKKECKNEDITSSPPSGCWKNTAAARGKTQLPTPQ